MMKLSWTCTACGIVFVTALALTACGSVATQPDASSSTQLSADSIIQTDDSSGDNAASEASPLTSEKVRSLQLEAAHNIVNGLIEDEKLDTVAKVLYDANTTGKDGQFSQEELDAAEDSLWDTLTLKIDGEVLVLTAACSRSFSSDAAEADCAKTDLPSIELSQADYIGAYATTDVDGSIRCVSVLARRLSRFSEEQASEYGARQALRRINTARKQSEKNELLRSSALCEAAKTQLQPWIQKYENELSNSQFAEKVPLISNKISDEEYGELIPQSPLYRAIGQNSVTVGYTPEDDHVKNSSEYIGIASRYQNGVQYFVLIFGEKASSETEAAQ